MIKTQDSSRNVHDPVMVPFVVSIFSALYGGRFLDLTVGQGGHSYWIMRSLKPSYLVCVDRDREALDYSDFRLKDFTSDHEFIHMRFSLALDTFAENNARFDGVLADLGMSNMQLVSDRGFSYKIDTPLDMRMDKDQKINLEKIIKDSSIEDLRGILSVSGRRDEAKSLAKAIYEKKNEIRTTGDLTDLIRKKGSRRDAAKRLSRCFQSFRMAVNEEIAELELLLEKLPGIVNPGGRVVIISYQSQEDSMVKSRFLEWEKQNIASRFFKHVVKPSKEEKAKNSKSRSAHLRCAEFLR